MAIRAQISIRFASPRTLSGPARYLNYRKMTHTLVSTAGKAIDLGADFADRLDEIAQQPDLIDALAEALAQDRPELTALFAGSVPS